jgi:O-antigen/teichoic acid export membrane protein
MPDQFYPTSRPALGRLMAVGARSGASIADQGATAAISFLASIFIGRKLGAEALGIYAITNIFVTLIRALQDCLVLEPMAVYGPRRTPAEAPGYFRFLIGLETLWVGALCLLVVLGSGLAWATGQIGEKMLGGLLASSVFAFTYCFLYFSRRQFYVDLRPYRALAQSLSYLALVVAGFVLMRQFGGWTVVDVYLVLAGCSVMVCLAQVRRVDVRRPVWPTRNEIRRYGRQHWSFGKWILLAVPLGIATYQGYFFFVGALVSAEAAGLLKAAETLVAPFFQISMGMGLMLIPMVAREIDRMSRGEQRAYALRLSLPLIALSLIYGGAVYLAGDLALRTLFGAKIAGAYPLIQIMAFVPLFVAAALPPSIVLSALRQANLRFVSQCIAVVGTVCVGVPLVIAHGLSGAAYGLLITEVLYALGQWGCLIWWWRRSAPLRWDD